MIVGAIRRLCSFDGRYAQVLTELAASDRQSSDSPLTSECLMISQANHHAGLSQTRRLKNSLGISLVAGLLLTALPMGQQALAYDGPTFNKGMWLFQRSTEYVTKHWILPNARRVKVEQPVVRCVNPTEAMIETFRP